MLTSNIIISLGIMKMIFTCMKIMLCTVKLLLVSHEYLYLGIIVCITTMRISGAYTMFTQSLDEITTGYILCCC